MKLFIVFMLCLLFALPAMPGIPERTEEGFRVPQPNAELSFPRAHAAHPEYKIEWWYLTGHLFAENGRRFGYQATFFRYARRPESAAPGSSFANAQLHLTHMALTDGDGAQFHYESRFHRAGWNAEAATDHFNIRHGNWRLHSAGDPAEKMRLTASVGSDVAWDLRLRPAKELVRFGPDGTSRKGPDPTARSYYLSFTRIDTTGTVTIGGREYRVTGSSWMDHEIASRQLDPDYEGWDWIAIQFDDGWEIKAYLLRQGDGTPSPFSALIWISPEGETRYVEVDGFTWKKDRVWQSPHSGARYPNAPVLTTVDPRTGVSAEFRFRPVIEDQELNLPGTTYWEGAGDVLDADGNPIGRAYLELVGYAGPIEGLR
mgnify:FL=1